MRDYAAAIAAALFVLYHYLTTRDFRRTLHRIADALESAPELAYQDDDVDEGDQASG